ncbi:hypothetical protein HK096_008805 [Nowakowskiella sp. JEL0078]|nr:hypothetical protein HK096_008805 [Nowakowskiella sp. JEL0078]
METVHQCLLLSVETEFNTIEDIDQDGVEILSKAISTEDLLSKNIKKLPIDINSSEHFDETSQLPLKPPQSPIQELTPKIFYAMEEIKLTLDLVTLLSQVPNPGTSPVPIADLVGVSGEQAFNRLSLAHLARTPAKPHKEQIEQLQYLLSSKYSLASSISEHLLSTAIRLEKATNEEKIFYLKYWIPLLEWNWIVQAGHANLVIDYGFRKDGSLFNERTEAEIWRGGEGEVEIGIVHSTIVRTCIYSGENEERGCKQRSFQQNVKKPTKVHDDLEAAQTSVFHTELFQSF